ncbi:MAG: cysteine desulfurase NifS [Clostridiales bacterium]|nr:cysteine desulfurase NifS [Clostridiales bacterium]
MKQVYLDYSATTPVKKEVLEEMIPFFSENFGNPSSAYTIGYKSRGAVDLARQRVASLVGAKEKEIFFTSSGTEANNWAIFGVCDAMKDKGNHIITTKIEHPAVLNHCEFLEKRGYKVTYLDVQKDGIVDPKALEDAITKDVILISIMLINNEIGTIQPLKELCQIAKKHNILFHTDAVQALGNIPLDVKELGIDLMSISAHKIYGPKGVGALYIKDGVKISNFMHGGSQEHAKRAGTENLTGIVGFGKAAEIAKEHLMEHIDRLTELRDYFIDRVMLKIPNVALNGHRSLRHPGNANLRFDYIEGESMLLFLDVKGISVSTGSACASEETTPSHVLTALQIPIEQIHSSVRFTLGDFTTMEDLDYTIEELAVIVEKLRQISPISK